MKLEYFTSRSELARYELSPDGKRLVLFDMDGTGAFYDVDSGKKVSEFKLPEPVNLKERQKEVPPIRYKAFSPDGRLLIATRGIGASVVLKTDTGEALPVLEGTELAFLMPGQNAFSGDSRLLVSNGARYAVKKFTTPGGKEDVTYGHAGDFLTVWDMQTGKALKSWDRSATVAFNPVRPLLAILEPNGDETRVGLWDFAAEVGKK